MKSNRGTNKTSVTYLRTGPKCLSFVDAVERMGAGIDVASEQECRQALNHGLEGAKIVCTAAIKTAELVNLCVRNRVTIAVDNVDELRRVQFVADQPGQSATVAIRVSGFQHQGKKLDSRFGFDIDEVARLMHSPPWRDADCSIDVVGLHFHLDGYCAAQRVSAIQQSLLLIDELRLRGHHFRFLDIGGGIPINYIEDGDQWDAFWAAQEAAVLGILPSVTYRNHGLGLINVDDRIHGSRNVYPYFQTPVRAAWLANVLDAKGTSDAAIAHALRDRSLELRCEPGRGLLDGCGLTVARVEFIKRHYSGHHFIGLAMNRTQCRTSSDDFLVDPLVVPCQQSNSLQPKRRDAIEGYLVGAYCTESELISLRRLQFPNGISVGDLVVLPNTAGYFMHFLESRSHQFPLAKNLVLGSDGCLKPDEIDERHNE